MSFLDRIRECNTHDLAAFLPFHAGGRHVGWIRRRATERLAGLESFAVTESAVALVPPAESYVARTGAMRAAAARLAADGAVTGWRDEAYAIMPLAGGRALFELERAACPWFGVRSVGLQVNGFVRRADEILLWTARRSPDKPTYPNMRDVFVAGGQPVGIGLIDNLVKEADEEAGVPAALARRAVPAGAISYCAEVPEGLKPDLQIVFDLELPEDFVPRNRDGEVAAFCLEPAELVMRAVRETRDFKFNCNLVIIDFLVRHGLIGPEEPDYAAIVAGLGRRDDLAGITAAEWSTPSSCGPRDRGGPAPRRRAGRSG